MIRYISAVALSVCVLTPPTAVLGGSFDSGCVTMHEPMYRFEDGKLFKVRTMPAAKGKVRKTREMLAFKTLRQFTIYQKEHYCVNRGGHKLGWEAHLYLLKIGWTESGEKRELWVMCQEAGDGYSPFSDTKCVKEGFTINREIVPKYRDLPK